MREIRSFSNQVENVPIRMDGEKFVSIGMKMNAGTWTQAKRLRRQNHNGVKSRVSPDSRPGDTNTLILDIKYVTIEVIPGLTFI
jgi:hypothetical protein